MEAHKSPFEELRHRIWVTKSVRFAAHHRLNRRHAWSIWAVAVLSVYLIAASVLAPIALHSGASQQIVNAGTIVASVLVLVLSLIEASRGYQLRAERLHGCAVALGKLELSLFDDSEGRVSENNAQLASLGRKYAAVLERCPENHDEIDYDSFRAREHKKYELSRFDRLKIFFRREASTIGPYLLAMFLPPAVVYFLASR